MKRRGLFHKFMDSGAVVSFGLAAALGISTGCTNKPKLIVGATEKQRFCAPVETAGRIPETPYLGLKQGGMMSFNDVRDAVNSACASCHRVPSKTGGFTYTDSHVGQELTVGGTTQFYPGLSETVEQIIAAMVDENSDNRMPPEDRRGGNSEAFLRIAENLKAWVAAGRPDGSFPMPGSAGAPPLPDPSQLLQTSELGDCIPAPESVGFDYRKDRFFAQAEKLPPNLTDTDMFTLDAYELAKKGTLAYNVEYPLWADNAEKGRWIHVPMKIEDGQLVRQTITYDPLKKQFDIPDFTRFYKTFYKLVKMKNGKPRYRRVETRIIVARKDWSKSLFGSYRWDESEQFATLVEIPYRDGTSFKDTIFKLTVDEKSGKQRKYALPGRHRCVECHMGSETQNFVLGFTPLQLNRRQKGEAGREDPVGKSELSQAERFVAYGLISGYQRAEELPRLEWVGTKNPRNIYEVKAQAYMTGNCAHCHNPNGFAFTKENGVTLDLRAGEIYEFNTHTRSTQIPTRRFVHHEGDLTQSHVYLKVSDPPSAQGLTSRMPMHTPGSPDCKVLKIIGQWVLSYGSIAAAEGFAPECKSNDDFDWVDQDFTWPKSDRYVPRRADWKDRDEGMTPKYRKLEFTPTLQKAVTKTYPVGYWNKKKDCRFPTVDLPKEQQRPWMINAQGRPKRPFGEVYSTTPGSWYYRTTCVKCHGSGADGNTALARGLLNWSGGSVRVANFIDGLFGNQGRNLKTFDSRGAGGAVRNLGGNYLIWMAMEGTRVQFPAEASNFVGKHGAQMLNQVREKCLRQISPEKASSTNFPDHEIFRDVCFIDNRSVDDPKLKFDPETLQPLYPEIVEEWADRAAYNAGWAIFQYLREAGEGRWQPGNDECERIFPNEPQPSVPPENSAETPKEGAA